MNYRKVALIFSTLLMMGGLANSAISQQYDAARPLPGTNTAIISVSVDSEGMPVVRDTEVLVKPGQKILFAGPDEFSIVFKNKKSPIGQIESHSLNGVVVVTIPETIFEHKEFVEEYRKSNELRFNYGVRVGNKELDPTVIVKREN